MLLLGSQVTSQMSLLTLVGGNQVLLHDIKALRQVKDWDFAWLFALMCSDHKRLFI